MVACQLGAALLWRITSAARWCIRSSGKIGESTGKIGAGDGKMLSQARVYSACKN